MQKEEIALVRGDGAAPEAMEVACMIAVEAAKKDDVDLSFPETPMGWKAYGDFGDTFPKESFKTATQIGTLFFGGVGDPEIDKTIGTQYPKMRPEARCLLGIRENWGLLLNFRPMLFNKAFNHLSPLKAEYLPEDGCQQHYIRYLLEDSYFGTSNVMKMILQRSKAFYHLLKNIGVCTIDEVNGQERQIIEFAYYTRKNIEKYLRYAFQYAKDRNLPLISVDKANVMARYKFWRLLCDDIHDSEFPDVELRHQLVDSANALLPHPSKLHGVIACGNEHGDILSDGAAEIFGGMGLMCSSAINPDNGVAMFESGAGTAVDIAGKDLINPLGRIWTAGMMLEHKQMPNGATAITNAVTKTLQQGYATKDFATSGSKIVGTKEMGEMICKNL
ncbi:MAG: isocitrate/isopropylmalate family dehydrogenase [Candidatus Moraniibacteriota bacterium]|jgi:3-isopropylmalate dehydrogenase